MDEPDPPPPGHAWLVPFALPLGIVVIVICAALLPTWAAIAVGVIILIVGVPVAFKTYADDRGGVELPSWLPGGRPGNR